jgi:hypothetical protein
MNPRMGIVNFLKPKTAKASIRQRERDLRNWKN